MRKDLLIDLKGVKDKLDMMNRFAEVLDLNPWDKKGSANWNAFDDCLSALYFEDLENDPNPEVHLVILGLDEVAKNISPEEQKKLKSSLDMAKDRTQRIDKYEFSYETR